MHSGSTTSTSNVTIKDNLTRTHLYRSLTCRRRGRPRARPSPACATAARDAVDELSGGMRRRLLLARGLVHEPEPGPARRADRRPRPADPDQELWTLIDGAANRGARRS